MYGFYPDKHVRPKRRALKILLMFKLTTVLILAGLLQVSAATLAQKITLREKGTPLEQVFDHIRDQSGYDFFFSATLLEKAAPVNINVKNEELATVLDKVFKDQLLTYVIKNNAVQVKAKDIPVSRPPSTAQGRIIGRVTDAKTGETLIGVTIRVLGRSGGTGINTSGRFSLEMPSGTYTLTANFIGYQQATINNVVVKDDEPTVVNIALEPAQSDLSEVTIKADRVITSTNEKLIGAMRTATGVVSGISSEQISISVDRSATEVARRVSGVTLQDGFISIRGMTPRYNPVYLNNAYMPSTDPNKRAFNFDLLPSNVIDRMLVYKSAAPELPADFAGGVVKIYTKASVPIRRTEISINGQYRTGNQFFSKQPRAASGKYDWLGFDDGTRTFPQNVPRNQYGEVSLPGLPNVPNNYTRTNEIITRALADRASRAWNIGQQYYPMDLLADLTHYDYVNIGKTKLSSVTVGRYERQATYLNSPTASRANRYKESEFPADGKPLTPDYDSQYRLSTDSVYQQNVRTAVMEHLSLQIDQNNDIKAMGLFNRNTKDVLQINTLREFQISQRSDLFPRRIESSYNNQDLLLGQLGGNHKIGGGRHQIEWTGSYSYAALNDPDQFSNVYEIDKNSIITKDNLESGGFGRINITPATQWKLNTITRVNTTVGRFYDGKGDESRWQGNFDYKFTPVKSLTDLYLRTGAYYEYRDKIYRMSTLAFKDYPEMPFSATPWENVGGTLADLLNQPGAKPMHTVIQDSGFGGQTYGYTASFKNAAGYAAASIPVKFKWPFGNHAAAQLDLYGGVRFEYSERMVYTTRGEQIRLETVLYNGKTVTTGTSAEPYQKFWLPSVSANLHITPTHQLRAAFGKTLNRPDLRELSPFVTYNPSDGFTYIGNPILHDARIDNYDLRWEWYPSDGEMISVGGYYKSISEPIEEIQKGLGVGVVGFSAGNLVFAKIRGLELDVRKKLDFIPGGIFRDMGIIVNGSLNLTKTNNQIPPRYDGVINSYPGGETRPFMGAAPWIVNAGLFYDNKESGSRFSLQLNTYADRLMANITDRIELEPWVFDRSRSLLDISLLQKITPWVSVRVAAQNLLNAPIRWYVDGDFNKKFNEAPTRFSYLRTAPGGPAIPQTFIQGDYYLRNYRPGVYYTLGFQFNLNGKAKNKSTK